MKPLAGMLVLDLTRLLPGGVATKQLVDWGAEVVKIEQPGSGDYGRKMSPAVFSRINAGKKSIGLDLKKPRGREILLSLARQADVLIEGNRPGVMARLGLGFAELHRANPRLVYVSLTGYGQSGPYAQLAGHDLNYMALGGVLSMNLPVIPGVQIADLVGGSMQSVTGILAALLDRVETGKGRHIDVSMQAGVASLLTVPLAAWYDSGEEPLAGAGRLDGRYACYNLYQAGDGRWLAVGALEPKFWEALCRGLRCEELIARQYEEPQDNLKASIAAIFKTKTARQWFDELRAGDCCVTPVLTVSEVAAELESPDEPPPPGLGEHTREILTRFGLVSGEIETLTTEEVIA